MLRERGEMTGYVWKPEYELGDVTIDTQHRQLLELANLVLEACARGRDERVIWKTFSALHHYTSTHFDDEEKMLAAAGSPLLEEQRRQHVALTAELKQLWTASRLNLLQDVMESLSSWLASRLIPHMMQADREARWGHLGGEAAAGKDRTAA